ncbi:uncharacterized iron-regulated protein [Vibrio ponticus]|nr:uncharacterized iron-regulated protein [Vibrio ponticus]
MQNADVILVGEWHTHTGIHRFQTDLLAELLTTNSDIALSMEQFSRDAQPIVDQYLAGKIGEQPLITQANAWPNYPSDYRPLIELAKANQLDVIAANAPRSIVRCVGKQGTAYLDKLSAEKRAWVANEINTQASPYKSKFMQSMHHGEPEQTEKQFAAQMTWDETMAESIVQYLSNHPNHKVMHIAGKFHVEDGLGTKASILRRNSALEVLVITPTANPTSDASDLQLHVLPPPERYIQQENRIKAYQSMSHHRSGLECEM